MKRIVLDQQKQFIIKFEMIEEIKQGENILMDAMLGYRILKYVQGTDYEKEFDSIYNYEDNECSIGQGYINVDGNSSVSINIFLENWNNIGQRIIDCIYLIAENMYGIDKFKGLPVKQKQQYIL